MSTRDVDQLWHVWINKRQQERNDHTKWEHSLYEFKNMLQFLTYGANQIQAAFEGTLPQTHQQCSHQPIEQLPVLNVLKCSREGVDVTKCPILQSLTKVFDESGDGLPRTTLYELMAKTCAWHIYTGAIGAPEGHHWAYDTSMGYLLDETDRIFWNRIHENMATSSEDL